MTADRNEKPPACKWADRFPVHPAASVFPLRPEQVQELAEDIAKHGLKEQMVLWRDAEGKEWLLDRRSRVEALDVIGFEVADEQAASMFRVEEGDPATLVISLNIRRRHLTKRQVAKIIVKAVSAAPPVSDHSDPKPQGGRPPDPVKAAATAEARKLGISETTVKRATKEYRQQPDVPAARNVSVSKKTTSKKSKRTTSKPEAGSVVVSAQTSERTFFEAVELWVDAEPIATRGEVCERIIAFVGKLKVGPADGGPPKSDVRVH